jgi:hypothetical protein
MTIKTATERQSFDAAQRAGVEQRAMAAVSAIVLLTTSTVAFAGHYPGSYTPDSWAQLGQALTRSYSDWHPPLMSAWWSLLIRATGTPSSLLAFHHLLLTAALAVLGALLIRQRAAPVALLVAAIPLFPVVVNFSGAMWKDIGCAFSLSLASAAAAWPRPRSRAGEALRLFTVIVSTAYATNVRWNALPAIFPLFVLAWRNRAPASVGGARALLRPVAVALVLTAGYAALPSAVTYRLLDARREYISGFMHAMDLAGLLARTGEDRLPSFTKTSPRVDASEITATYWRSVSWGSSGFLFWAYDGKEPPLRVPRSDGEAAELTLAWRDAIRHHPGAYLRHRGAFMAKLLRIGEARPYFHYLPPQEREELDPLTRAGPLEARMHSVLMRDHASRSPASEASRRIVAAIVRSIGENRAFLGWPWLVLALGIAASSLVLAQRAPVTARAAALVALSGLLYAASYLPIAPVSDFRFLYWTVLATLLAAAAWLSAILESQRRN